MFHGEYINIIEGPAGRHLIRIILHDNFVEFRRLSPLLGHAVSDTRPSFIDSIPSLIQASSASLTLRATVSLR
jgi:hypothetical protein